VAVQWGVLTGVRRRRRRRRSRGRRRSGNANYVQATCLGSREIGPVPWNSKLGCHC